ncbi:MAG: WXG100 family type VII secretion target [Oscillospiraceae bacterium]|jgi:WXG100 family type VII secretion target|nr:WXG100 family type VII secretion target [Oscillospiraceae bacterium]
MAERVIKVDTGDLRSASSAITTLAGEYEALYKDMYAKMSDMKSTWTGIDINEYITQIEGFRDDFQKMKTEMDHYADHLTQSAIAYEKAQDDTVANAKKLVN